MVFAYLIAQKICWDGVLLDGDWEVDPWEKNIQLLKGGFIGLIKDWLMYLIKRYYETKLLDMIRNGIQEEQINKGLSKCHHIYPFSFIIENELAQ